MIWTFTPFMLHAKVEVRDMFRKLCYARGILFEEVANLIHCETVKEGEQKIKGAINVRGSKSH